ncbi:MAG: hypothetical protein J6Z31_01175 [Fibrobacter sp.]|nr:hypothetical protein [Fibrobacter sp.]
MKLIVILSVLFALSLFGEKIPIQDGAGFDGEFYRLVAENFSADFWNQGYDAFRIQRIFPFCAIHYGFKLLHISTTHTNLMHAMLGLHALNLLLQVLLFWRISKILQWKSATKGILFAVFFLNFFTLKNCGYEPFQSDAFAISLSLSSLYFYLKKKKLYNLGIAVLGAVTWPLITLQAILLVAFDRPLSFEKEGKTFPGKFAFFYGALALLTIAALKRSGHGIVVTNLLMRDSNWALTMASLGCALFGLFWIVRCIPRFRMNVLTIKNFGDWKWLGIFLSVWVGVKLFLSFHVNEEFFCSNTIFALQILLRPLKYPLISFVGHVAFYGILPILVAFTFRSFAKTMMERSVGFAMMFGMFLLLALDSESRHMATLVPFLLVPLGNALDKWELKNFQVAALVLLQLLLSHFYVPINSEGLLEELESGNLAGDAAMRYFMNFGAYMNLESYLLWLGISLITAIACYGILKNQIKSKKKTSL